MELNKKISIEQFAAFLDRNLPEDEMQAVATAIDSSREYSDILGEVMHVDDVTDKYMSQSEVYSDTLPDIDFELPIVPELVKTPDVIDVTAVEDTESETVELINDDVRLTLASEETESTPSSLCLSETQVESSSFCNILDMEQQTEDINDFTDLA